MSRRGLANWTKEELFAFFSALESRYDIVFHPKSKNLSRELVYQTWQEAAAECVARGYTRFRNRNSKALRNDLYRKKRNDLLRRYQIMSCVDPNFDESTSFEAHEQVILRICRRQRDYNSEAPTGVITSNVSIGQSLDECLLNGVGDNGGITTANALEVEEYDDEQPADEEEEEVMFVKPMRLATSKTTLKQEPASAEATSTAHISTTNNKSSSQLPTTSQSADSSEGGSQAPRTSERHQRPSTSGRRTEHITLLPPFSRRRPHHAERTTDLLLSKADLELKKLRLEASMLEEELMHKRLRNYELQTQLGLPAMIGLYGEVYYNSGDGRVRKLDERDLPESGGGWANGGGCGEVNGTL